MYGDQIRRVAAHRSVDSKLQYKICWRNGRSSWTNADLLSPCEHLRDYWEYTDVEYVNKECQTDNYDIIPQTIEEILQKKSFKEIIQNPIKVENKKENNCFSKVIIDDINLTEKMVSFHVGNDKKTELPLNEFRIIYPQALALYLTENA